MRKGTAETVREKRNVVHVNLWRREALMMLARGKSPLQTGVKK